MTRKGSTAQVAFGPTSPSFDANTSGVELASDRSFAHSKLLRHRRERGTIRVASGSVGNIGRRKLPQIPATLNSARFKMIHDGRSMDSMSASNFVDG